MTGPLAGIPLSRPAALPSREFITDVLAQSVLDPRRRALYDLCFLERGHLRDDAATEKLRRIAWLYAEDDACVFSPEAAAQRLARSGADRWFGLLASAEVLDTGRFLETHRRTMAVFAELGEAQARSLASKYLHFHFPELFYVYDSVVASALSHMGVDATAVAASADHDLVYARHYAGCCRLAEALAPQLGRRLSPRELDPVLRAWSERQARVSGLLLAATLPNLRV